MHYPQLGELTATELADAADANFVVHAGWALLRTPGMRVVDRPELVLADSGLPGDTFNIICRARLAADQARERIRAAIELFEQARRPFSWWVGPGDRPQNLGALLLEAGLLRAETELAMAADLSALGSHDHAPAGLEIRRVDSAAQLADFVQIIAGPEDRRFYERAAPALLAPDSPQWRYVGYLGGQPVATAELTIGGGVAGLYNITTLADYRRQGIGTAITLRPLLDARAQGVRTGVLQAAAQGVGIYTQIGFRRFGDITEYKPATGAQQPGA
jgi:ribosomal protein S18 acetylase RimI-like enzyme